ncbi:superoxide dismutase [Thecamonas trahens ATCC 50062]|uniref:Superoxide dismutase n=1 Tax=Thecamonas trahens ATCC 50062 TaxID=461836 RepID=A0A0L0DEP8_THETB|nr:superoxide dismutase [Thecamonas trahens ATCC 50062]KNC50695.1 superoxide dismutase [Thecamonas trahens ATCC 50062]|eukprot:XP_013762572.1 superoxide dismutase [Thecamonas trahens ATCC 50062]
MKLLNAVVVLALVAAVSGADVLKATCELKPAGDNDVSGTIELSQAGVGGVVTFTGTVNNLPDGLHALHVHTYGDVTVTSGKGAGGHWNPHNKTHGCYPSTDRHAGDVGDISVSGGTYTFPGSFERDLLELSGVNSVIGRSLVIHANTDSCTGTAGDAGARLAQCVIGVVDPGTDTQLAHYRNPTGTNTTWAVAVIDDLGAGRNVAGKVWFQHLPSGKVRVYPRLSGSFGEAEQRALHVHTYGKATGTGGHYNPAGVNHALPMGVRHMGDMGNVVSTNGTSPVYSSQRDFDLLDMGAGLDNIIGRAAVMHDGRDTGEQPTGAAGTKIAAGPIGISNGAPAKVTVVIKGTSNAPGVSGLVTLEQLHGPGTPVTISGSVSGLPAGDHAFHIHTYGNPTVADGTGAMGHYNPDGVSHGCSPNARHAGDIGTITAASDGTYTFPADFTRDLIDLTGPRSVVGRAIVIHADRDDCNPPSGNAGSRLAVGVIGLSAVSSLEINSGYAGEEAPPPAFRAVAVMQSIEEPKNSRFEATMYFEQINGDKDLRIYGIVKGLQASSVHGIHVHQNGDLSSATGANLGGHYNPYSVAHGLPPNVRHYGDLGNFAIYKDGTGYVNMVVPGVQMSGVDSIIGRALVFHSGSDKGTGASGDAGVKIAAGVIGICDVNCWPRTLALQPVDEGEKIHPATWVILAVVIVIAIAGIAAGVVFWRKKKANAPDSKLDFI